MFLINPSSVNKTLFYRINNAINLEEVASGIPKSESPTRGSPKKRSKGKQSAKAVAVQP